MRITETELQQGAELFGVDPASLRALGGPPDDVFTCRKGNLSYAIRYLHLPEERIPAIAEKLRFARYLADGGAPVAGPVESKRGSLYEALPGRDGSLLVFLAPHSAGQRPTARNLYYWNEKLFSAWGKAMGKMHALARLYPLWEKGPGTCLMDPMEELETFQSQCSEPKIAARFAPLADVLRALPRDRASYGLIHNDMHPETFLYFPDTHPERPLVITNYDHMLYGWFASDVATALYSALAQSIRGGLAEREAFAQVFMKPFYKGYRVENELDVEWFTYLPTFLQMRELITYIALSREWPAERRQRWQSKLLSEKRTRLQRGEPVIAEI